MLQKQIDAKDRATFSTVVGTTTKMWRDEDLGEYMAMERAKHAGIWPLSRMSQVHIGFSILALSALIAFGAAHLCNFIFWHLLGGLLSVSLSVFVFLLAGFVAVYTLTHFANRFGPWEWHTLPVDENGTYRDRFGERRLPSFARKLTEDIRRLHPGARFEISVLGPDPVLWCKDETYRERLPVLVWDEFHRIVPPPRPYE